MSGDDAVPTPPLRPEELDRLQAQDPGARAEWALADIARWEEAWLLENADGWVLFKLANAPEGRSPWALPLWPRQELAALAARDAGEQPRRLDIEALLDDLLPLVAERGWQVMACPAKDNGSVEDARAFAARLQDVWAVVEEDGE